MNWRGASPHMSQFEDLTWDDLHAWAGSRIVFRGRSYQEQGYVSDLARTEDGALVAWVGGSNRYATKVGMDADGKPDSICTCPYAINCKHGVAVLLEYLERLKHGRRVPQAGAGDKRLGLLAGEDRGGDVAHNDVGRDDSAPTRKAADGIDAGQAAEDLDAFLRGKTKAQLMGLIRELAGQYPEIAQALADRCRMAGGDAKTLLTRLRQEIRAVGAEPGWQNYWRGEGHTPDYSGIRKKLEVLLKGGYADEVLTAGEELLTTGTRQVEESQDQGETAAEIIGCMPVIVKALDSSSLDGADRLSWALDAVLADDYGICEAFAEYLRQPHPQASWQALADRLLARLPDVKSFKGADAFDRGYARDRLGDWAVHALEGAGREDEIIPLCEAEATKTGSYQRLVGQLVTAGRYEEAERWIRKGYEATKEPWPGIAAGLRDQLREIRALEENWPAVAAMQAEEFVRRPSRKAFTDCREVAERIKAWPTVRERLLDYLETGVLPWEREVWPLPETHLDEPAADPNDCFPMAADLIGIAILEERPDEVLRWYDRLPQQSLGWYRVNEDEIATAVQDHAPDRAVAIWQSKAERLIARVQPSAYQEAATYLRKAGRVMARRKETEQWHGYLRELRQTHARKRRLMEILDGLEGVPIVKKRH